MHLEVCLLVCMKEVYYTHIMEDDMIMQLTHNRPPFQTAGNVKKAHRAVSAGWRLFQVAVFWISAGYSLSLGWDGSVTSQP